MLPSLGEMPQVALGLSGRTECAPKTTLRVISLSFPRKAVLAWKPLAEGRAPHARGEGLRLIGASPYLATRRSFAPDDYVMSRLASGP